QINVQVDFDISPGPATVVINNNGSTASISGVQILDVQPGIFEVSVGGGRFAAALHANFSLVTPSNPARPGEIILLFLTGMGPLIPPVGTNVPGPIPPAATMHPAVVGIDDVGMETLASVYAPTLVTAYQVNFRVGDNVQSGNRRLVVIVNGIPSQPALLPVGR
ncbi:MAG: hypothetical protein GY953_43085, partial [bacterium]|nr:hypothetical protein [bacterium]